MNNIAGLVEYKRLFVIETLLKKIDEKKALRDELVEQYYQDVAEYKALPWYKKLITRNPEKPRYEWYESALEDVTSAVNHKIAVLQEQVDAFALSTSETVWVNTDSWLISWLK